MALDRHRGAAALRVAALLLVGLTAPAAANAAAKRFGIDQVVERARNFAERPYEDPRGKIPQWLLDLSYDQWREIRYRPERALWADLHLPFTVQFFHPGLFYDRTVRVNVVEGRKIVPVDFSPGDFDYGRSEFASRVPQDLGWAGFRVHYPIKTRSYEDEVIVFLGASYFRAVGRDQVFGLSARGLAIDTALPSGEEFPWFREFWLVRPAAVAKSLTLYALLDSPSLTGAYRFEVTPGVQTQVDVEMHLFRRTGVKKLGIAPLTSMFLRGEAGGADPGDYRPEVHDSDGLLMASSTGEWIWRPLENPRSLSVTSFALTDPRGFGLLQRDRAFDHYQDLEARPDLRPSAWIAPAGAWGAGRVELVEIPTHRDANDNIVAYWVPSEVPPPKQPIAYSYSVYWYGDDPLRPPGGRAVATRRDTGSVEGAVRFLVDFEGRELAALPEDTVLRAIVSVGGSDEAEQVLEQQVLRNPVTKGWRLVFQVRRPEDEPVELRAFLQREDQALTETWTYLLRP
jgi:periplasmic glucans biosynthesis protein